MVQKALKMVALGDVLVVDTGGDLTNATIGELMRSCAIAKNAAAVVISGAIRDVGWFRENRLPVCAASVTHCGPSEDGPGEINLPAPVEGMLISPGDLVIDDGDGILCVPADRAREIYGAAEAKRQAEAKFQARIAAGDLDEKVWGDEAPRNLGCEEVEAEPGRK